MNGVMLLGMKIWFGAKCNFGVALVAGVAAAGIRVQVIQGMGFGSTVASGRSLGGEMWARRRLMIQRAMLAFVWQSSTFVCLLANCMGLWYRLSNWVLTILDMGCIIRTRYFVQSYFGGVYHE